MWEPLLQREIEDCSLQGWWRGPGPRSVFCLLAPPEHASTPEAHKSVQRRIATIYRKLQERRDPPSPVGLQADFFVAARTTLGEGLDLPAPAGFIDQGGPGIVAALAEEPRPLVLCLDDEQALAGYREIQDAAFAVLAGAAPFFARLIESYRDAERSFDSPAVRELKRAAAAVREGGRSLPEHVGGLLTAARAAGIELPPRAFGPLLDYEKISELEEKLDEAAVDREKQALEKEIRERARPSEVDPRAALELTLHEIRDRHGNDPEHQGQIAECRRLLALPILPELPDWVLQLPQRSLDQIGGHLMQVIQVRPEDQGRPSKGYAELISRYLELATVLGIEVDRYEALRTFVYYSRRLRRLEETHQFEIGGAFFEALERLESSLLGRSAVSEAERGLLARAGTVKLIETLRRQHMPYGEEGRKEILRFEAGELCRFLAGLGVGLPRDWERLATDLDARFEVVRELHDRTHLRAKEMASTLVARMGDLRRDQAILCCESHFRAPLEIWFRGNGISFSMLLPRL